VSDNEQQGSCVTCRRRDPHPHLAPVCGPCRSWLTHTLTAIPDWWARLPDVLEPGTTVGERVTGTPEQPAPLRLDPLDLMTPVTRIGGVPVDAVHDPHGDQVGPIPAAQVLDQEMRAWADAGAPGSRWRPVPTVPVLADWLAKRADWACTHYPGIDATFDALHTLRADLRRALGETEPLPERILHVPCRECDNLTLYRVPGSDYVECGNCPALLTHDEFRGWARLVAEHARQRHAA